MVRKRAVAHYTGEAGRRYAAQFNDPRTDIVGRCFVDKVGAWIAADDKVLEFGCGKGRNVLATPCREKAGYDINEHSRRAAAEAGLHVYDSPDHIPRGYWDVVVCHHVLEHVSAPAATLELLRSFLAPGGRLILTVPVEGHLRSLRPAEEDIDRHLYCWNPTTIRNLLDVAGFRLRNITVRWAACENRAEPFTRVSWRVFKAAVWTAGTILRRCEMTCIAEPLK